MPRVIIVRSRSTRRFATTTGNRFLLIAGVLLFLVGGPLLLWRQAGFAEYALTGFSWIHTQGTVTDSFVTSKPNIQFAARDGSPVVFTENYVQICRHNSLRSLCSIRYFNPGEVVPIVYNPRNPERAFVYDWALFATAIQWFIMLGIVVVVALLVYWRFFKATGSFSSNEIGASYDPE